MMIKTFLDKNRIAMILLTSIGCAAVLFLVHINEEEVLFQSVFKYYVFGYSTPESWTTLNLEPVLLLVFLSLPLVTLFTKNFSMVSTYIFTRTGSRKRWYLNKVASLLFYIALSAIIFTTTMCLLMNTVGNLKISLQSDFLLIAKLCFILFLGESLFALFVNVISVFIGGIPAFATGTFLFGLFALLCTQIKSVILFRLNPISNFMEPWHYCVPKTSVLAIQEHFTTEFSIVYFLVLITLLVLIGCFSIDEMDVSIKHLSD